MWSLWNTEILDNCLIPIGIFWTQHYLANWCLNHLTLVSIDNRTLRKDTRWLKIHVTKSTKKSCCTATTAVVYFLFRVHRTTAAVAAASSSSLTGPFLRANRRRLLRYHVVLVLVSSAETGHRDTSDVPLTLPPSQAKGILQVSSCCSVRLQRPRLFG